MGLHHGARPTGNSRPSLLDIFSGAAAAYSLRTLSFAVAQDPVVRVRRSSDNTEQDFTSVAITNGDLVTFCGSGDGLVTTWYDQSGNGNDAAQSTANSQPKIVNTGVLVTENDKAAILLQSADSSLSSSYELLQDENFLISAAYRVNSISNINARLLSAVSSSVNLQVGLFPGNRNSYWIRRNGSPKETVNNFNVFGTQRLLVYASSNNSDIISVDGQNQSIQSDGRFVGSNSSRGNGIHIGDAYEGIGSYSISDGTVSEVIIYPTDQSQNRTSIETNINLYYNIF